MAEIIFKAEAYRIIGAAMEVHRELGNGFLEAVYQESLTIEMEEQQVPFEREKELILHCKGRKLERSYQAHFCLFWKNNC